MKLFTDSDINPAHIDYRGVTGSRSISADIDDLIDAPMWYHLKGLQQTSSGYGRKLNTGKKLSLNGKLYRIYSCVFSNSGTNYITVRGETIIVN